MYPASIGFSRRDSVLPGEISARRVIHVSLDCLFVCVFTRRVPSR